MPEHEKNLITLGIDVPQGDPRNSNRMPADRFAKAKAHIQQTGNYPVPSVRELPASSRYFKKDAPTPQYMWLDGHHRHVILRELNYAEITVDNWGEMSDAQAGVYLLTLNRNTGEDDPMLRGKLMQDVATEVSVENIALVAPEDVVDVRTLMELAQVDLGLPALPDDEPEPESGGVPELDTETVMPIRFALYPAQHTVIMTALLHLQATLEGRNKPARALELMAADYLAGLSEEEQESARIIFVQEFGDKNADFAPTEDAEFTLLDDQPELPSGAGAVPDDDDDSENE